MLSIIAILSLIRVSFCDYPVDLTHFDLREKYPECSSVSSPLNQGSCGSCWAFSTTSTTADRLCIQGWTNEFMAPEHSVQCDTGNDACNGGYIKTAFDFQVTSGVVPLVCKAYRDTQTRRCAATCDNTDPITSNMLFKPRSRTEKLSTEQAIKNELYNFGSVTGSFKVFEEFYTAFDDDKKFKYEVTASPGAFETYHAVKIIGWEDDSWLVQNSWGKGWADGGYFRIKNESGEIHKDIYASVVDRFEDKCSLKNGFKCSDCGDVTEIDDKGKKVITPCKLCLTTDKCIQVNSAGAPVRGICQRFADNASMCPLDDCEQMSPDPIRCLAHAGCGYCVSTKKCRKGIDRPNTGECTKWFNETSTFATAYKGVRYTKKEDCATADNKNLWCEGIGKCLEKVQNSNSTQVGRCYGTSRGVGVPVTKEKEDFSNGVIVSADNCSDITDREVCENTALSCKWCDEAKTCRGTSCKCCPYDRPDDPEEEPCVPVGDSCPPLPSSSAAASTSTSASVALGMAQSAEIPRLSNANTSVALGMAQATGIPRLSNQVVLNDATCLQYTCKTCNNAVGCVWCATTQSCIAKNTPFDPIPPATVKTIETHCSQINDGTNPDVDPCSTCIEHSSCTQCALDPKCGWWDISSFCTEGRKEPKKKVTRNGAPFEDTFFSYKMQCEIVSVDELEPYEASLDYKNGGAAGAAARIVRTPAAAVYLLTAVTLLVTLFATGFY